MHISYPKISIITPSFNQGQFIEETILSVLNQNYPHLEYIIIDGGSTDNSVDIIKKYKDKITYWVSEKDNGQSHAINKGFKKATGDIVTWLNSDDMLFPKALETIGKVFINNPETDFTYGECEEWFQTGEKKVIPLPLKELDVKRIYGFPYFQPASFYKRSALFDIGLLNEALNFSMDRDLFLRFAINKNILKIEEILAIYRHHDDSKSHNIYSQSHHENLQILSNLYASINKGGELEQLYNTLIRLEILPSPLPTEKYTITNHFNEKDWLKALLLGVEGQIKQFYIKGKFCKLNDLFNQFSTIEILELVKNETSLKYIISRKPLFPFISLKRRLLK
jgi:glycosyltransferase involved in cell wall biosynthesis